jgi:hypothetical protein
MPDEVCGAECVDGSECQHPAGSCPVPSHSDPDAENPHGRDFAISEDDHGDILDAARHGMSKAGCARAAGVDEKSLKRYLDAHEDFRRTFARARHKGERRLVEGPLQENPDPNAPEMDGQHARFLLSTSFEYVKTEKKELEHSGDEDNPVQHSVTYNVVDGDE